MAYTLENDFSLTSSLSIPPVHSLFLCFYELFYHLCTLIYRFDLLFSGRLLLVLFPYIYVVQRHTMYYALIGVALLVYRFTNHLSICYF